MSLPFTLGVKFAGGNETEKNDIEVFYLTTNAQVNCLKK